MISKIITLVFCLLFIAACASSSRSPSSKGKSYSCSSSADEFMLECD